MSPYRDVGHDCPECARRAREDRAVVRVAAVVLAASVVGAVLVWWRG